MAAKDAAPTRASRATTGLGGYIERQAEKAEEEQTEEDLDVLPPPVLDTGSSHSALQ